jgi:hypothetical protein
VLVELGRASVGEERSARTRAYAAIDPLVRGMVRARVVRAVADAMFATERGDDEPHVHRLAWLEAVGQEAEAPNDVERVRAAFTEATRRSARPAFSRLRVSGTLGLVVVLGLVTAGGAWLLRPAPDAHLGTPVATAYRTGGRPLPGLPVTQTFFASVLPDFVVALDALRVARGTPLEREARAECERVRDGTLASAREALGTDTTTYLRAVLEQSLEVVSGDGALAADSHVRTVDAFNAAVAARGLGYYVDTEVMRMGDGRGRVLLATFAVERVTPYRSGGRRVNALRIRRLDTLNFDRAILGFTRPNIRDGLVLRTRVEDHLVSFVVPALAEGAQMPLADVRAQQRAAPWVARVGAAAGQDARLELRGYVRDAAGLAELGRLLGRRNALFLGWSDALLLEGIRLPLPDRYDLDLERFANIKSLIAPSEWRELEDIQDALSDESMRSLFRAVADPLERSIEHHEVQHRLDFLSGALARLPPEIEAYTGALAAGERRNERAERTTEETSAYLAELARDPSLVKTKLALVSAFLFREHGWGSAESYAGLVVFEGLARELGLTHGPLVVRMRIDRDALATLYLALRAKPAPALARAAQRLWERLYARPLPPLEDVSIGPSR